MFMVTGSGHQLPVGILDQFRALRAVVVQHVDVGFAGDEGDGADAPNLEAADILLAADVGAREGRNGLAAVTGDHGAQQVERQDVLLCQGAGLKYLPSITGWMVLTLPPRKLPAKVVEMNRLLPPVGLMG